MRVIKYGNPILRTKAEPVKEIDHSILNLVDEMITTLREHEGIGLAATQVAETKSLFVIDMSLIEENGKPTAIINPVILSTTGECTFEEGCLSVPGIREEVKRPEIIRVRYQDIEGNEHEEEFGDLRARVFQHEIDHLNGVFFVDRISSMKRRLIQKELKEISDEETGVNEKIAAVA